MSKYCSSLLQQLWWDMPMSKALLVWSVLWKQLYEEWPSERRTRGEWGRKWVAGWELWDKNRDDVTYHACINSITSRNESKTPADVNKDWGWWRCRRSLKKIMKDFHWNSVVRVYSRTVFHWKTSALNSSGWPLFTFTCWDLLRQIGGSAAWCHRLTSN